MKKVHMELGGNAPFIVFNDADINLAVEGLIASKFRNAGQVIYHWSEVLFRLINFYKIKLQTCVSANKILIQEKIFDKFLEKFVEAVKKLKVGPGLEEDTDISSLINDKHLEKVKIRKLPEIKLEGNK
jgi:succinate-semialdehyde dehydrogenase/glutarate-semialdehyde dehydrogenase